MDEIDLSRVSGPKLRDACNVVANRDGYSVRAIPGVSLDGTTVYVTFMASDGMTFPGTLPADAVRAVLCNTK